ncbi:MAG: hypothetical protein J6R99_03810, partial [Alphaproteobacteria bacterium]|nr:hypothetical protein [Alphaproteobacteria bacterium]
MSGFSRLFGLSAVSMGLCVFALVADAATGRGDYANVRNDVSSSTVAANGRAGAQPTAARMPSMPVMSIGTVGNITTTVPGAGNNYYTGGMGTVYPPNTNVPGPDGTVGGNNGGAENTTPGACVKDEYTVENCMNHLTACINNGALPHGMNDMFNADLRASIINGMGLCSPQVDKCIKEVTRNCNPDYFSRADVWTDLNSRRVQPEYYNFVLRKTGLTPTQAENTCWLLDSNTYGASFNRVSNDGIAVDDEFGIAKRAYNAQKIGVKYDPLGQNGLDDEYQRGHYARWDAIEGECLIRVAAYNKDKLITNKMLGMGDDKVAETWMTAGSTFTCNKELFDFSLMKDTQATATISLPGGAGLGGSVGAGVGAWRAKDLAKGCESKEYRERLWKKIKDNSDLVRLNKYLGSMATDLSNPKNNGKKAYKNPETYISKTDTELSQKNCETLVRLNEVYTLYNDKINWCEHLKSSYTKKETITATSTADLNGEITLGDVKTAAAAGYKQVPDAFNNKGIYNCGIPGGIWLSNELYEFVEKCLSVDFSNLEGYVGLEDGPEFSVSDGKLTIKNISKCYEWSSVEYIQAELTALGVEVEYKSSTTSTASPFEKECKTLPSINVALLNKTALSLATCGTEKNNKCMEYNYVKDEVTELGDVLSSFDFDIEEVNKGAEIAKGAGIGAAIGLGVGRNKEMNQLKQLLISNSRKAAKTYAEHFAKVT